MHRRTGLQAEVLVSLALVMLGATGIVAAVVRSYDEARLRVAVGRALQAEARAPGPPSRSLYPGTTWWRLEGETGRPWGILRDELDPVSRQVGAEARERHATVVRPGAAGEPIRFATVLEDGTVVVARLPVEGSERLRAVPGRLLAALLLLDAAVFTAFGVFLLRRRVLLPLQRLREAARTLAEGDLRSRVPEDGVRETAELAAVFNDMGDALEARTEALEKAVADLRGANRELKEAREGLYRAERLASVGTLAAGVAHEVGNPMGAILAFLELARRDPGISERTREHLERAVEQGGRVRGILRQLLDFSRPSPARPQPLDLAAAAEEAAGLVRAQRRYGQVRIRVAAEGPTPCVRADPGVVAQVLLNLLLNAADAVRDRPQGRVQVTLRPTVLERRADDPPDAVPGRRQPDAVACIVADDGPGVAEADRERIFDPFFTTKDPGEGTGLGLANAQRLVESLGGRLSLISPGALGGAEFHMVLPAVAGEAHTGPAGDPQAVRSAP